MSHWTADVAKLEVYVDWSYGGDFHHLFGRLTYRGRPVYGFRTTSNGIPLDPWRRNVYLDTRYPDYGKDWQREISFVTHKGTGVFCYGFYRHDRPAAYPPGGTRPPGHGKAIQSHRSGAGVTPIIGREGRALPDFDPGDSAMVKREQGMNALQRSLGDPLCRTN